MNKTVDMTTGNPLKQISFFTIPLLMSGTVEMIYNLSNSAIVGRLIGLQAYTALGATNFPYWMVFCLIAGLISGFSSIFAQRFGAKKKDAFNKSVAMALLLAFLIGIPITIISVISAEPLLVLLNTPGEILRDSSIYLRIRFASLLVIFVSKIFTSVFHGAGNSKTPFLANLISVILNPLLSILLVQTTSLGVAAIAIATVLSQMTVVLFLVFEIKRHSLFSIKPADMKPDRHTIKELLRIGAPLAFRDLPSAVLSLAIQYAINGYGGIYIAGIASAKALYSILFVPAESLAAAITAFVGQNYGVRNLKRIALGIRKGTMLLLLSMVILIPLIFFTGRSILSFFIPGDSADIWQTWDVGMSQLRIILLFLPTYYFSRIFNAALLGMGNGFYPLVSGIIEAVARIIALSTLPPLIGVWGIYLVEVIGWPLMMLQLIISYRLIYRQLEAGHNTRLS